MTHQLAYLNIDGRMITGRIQSFACLEMYEVDSDGNAVMAFGCTSGENFSVSGLVLD